MSGDGSHISGNNTSGNMSQQPVPNFASRAPPQQPTPRSGGPRQLQRFESSKDQGPQYLGRPTFDMGPMAPTQMRRGFDSNQQPTQQSRMMGPPAIGASYPEGFEQAPNPYSQNNRFNAISNGYAMNSSRDPPGPHHSRAPPGAQSNSTRHAMMGAPSEHHDPGANQVAPRVLTRDTIRPVNSWSQQHQAPKAAAQIPRGEGRLIRDMRFPGQSDNPTNDNMVALRLQHDDLRNLNYSVADLPLLRDSVAAEQAGRLQELLLRFCPAGLKNKHGGLMKKNLLVAKTRPDEELKPIKKWCNKRTPQCLLEFWFSDGFPDMTRVFRVVDTSQDLSIFDLLAWIGEVESIPANGRLLLSTPPSHAVAMMKKGILMEGGDANMMLLYYGSYERGR
jgi:hypothetical protein